MRVNHAKTAAKTITWRVWAGADTLIITYVATGRVDTAFGVVGTEFLTKFVWYYVHEWLWAAPVLEDRMSRAATFLHGNLVNLWKKK